MTEPKRESLLPIGETIEHDGRPLHILKRLGAGLTGEVYQAELEADGGKVMVAVKAMKSLNFPMARQMFETEGLTLPVLKGLEDKANSEQGLDFQATPTYYGRGDYEGTPFLVMEFIAGRELPDLLAAQGVFSEPKALTMAWHLYRTLDLLHTGIKKAYIDLKFENLWWVETPDNAYLKITDFGTLEDLRADDPQQRGARRDVLLGGVYLLAFLTGYILKYSLGELQERAEPIVRVESTLKLRMATARQRLGEGDLEGARALICGDFSQDGKVDISWGVRQLLLRLLHRNPERRLGSAAAVASELRRLVNWWHQPTEKTVEAGRTLLLRAEVEAAPYSDRARENLVRARSALDIARLRLSDPDPVLKEDIERADRWLSTGDYLERGRALLLGRAYGDARRVFEEGMDWSGDPAPLRRWAYLARIGDEVSLSVFDSLRDEPDGLLALLERLNQGRWQDAKERLESIRPRLQSQALEYLYADCTLFDQLEKAESARGNGDFGQAAQAYRAAMDWLGRLPDAEFVRSEEVGDMRLRFEEMRQLEEMRGLAQRDVEAAADAIGRYAWDEAVARAKAAFERDRQNPARLADLRKLADAALERRGFSAAARLAEIGLGVPHPPPELLAAFKLADHLWAAERLLLSRGQHPAFIETLKETLAGFAAHPAAVPGVLYLLGAAAEAADRADDGELLSLLLGLSEPLGEMSLREKYGARAQVLLNSHRERLAGAIDRCLADAALTLDDLNPSRAPELALRSPLAEMLSQFQDRRVRLEKASARLDDAERMALSINGLRRTEILDLRARIHAMLERAQGRELTLERMADDERSRQVGLINQKWTELQRLRAGLRNAAESGAAPEVLLLASRQVRDGLSNFIRRCYAYLAEVDAQDKEVLSLLDQAAKEGLDEMGVGGWQQLGDMATERLERIRNDFERAQAAFVRGDLSRTMAEVDRLEPHFRDAPEWIDLKANLTRVLQWQTWQQEHAAALDAGLLRADLLKMIREFLSLNIPAAYWHNSAGEAYLNRVREAARREVKARMDVAEQPEFVEYLRAWFETEMTARAVTPPAGATRRSANGG